MVDLGTARAEREATSVLVIGDTATAQRVCATFTADSGRTVVHLVAPTDEQLAEAVSARVASAAILVHDDVAALRYAMSLGHLDPELPVTVAMFDRTIAGQLTKHLPHATIASPAALAAPSLAGPCLGRHVQATLIEGRAATTVTVRDGELIRTPHVLPRAGFLDRVRNWINWDHRHSDPGTKLMLIGLFGMCAILVIDIGWQVSAHHYGVVAAILEATKVLATVGPGPSSGGTAYHGFASVAMLSTIVLTALFTAGVVDRLLEPRLVGLVGARTPPRRDHVIVVGMGQVGIRLSTQLRSMGIPVVGVERSRDAPLLGTARALGIPVVIANGSDRRTLERVHLRRCRALAAVGSDDLDNVAVAVVAAAISPHVRVVFRAGEKESVAETRSLLPLGIARDVTQLASAFVVALARGQRCTSVVVGSDGAYVLSEDSSPRRVPVADRSGCPHRCA